MGSEANDGLTINTDQLQEATHTDLENNIMILISKGLIQTRLYMKWYFGLLITIVSFNLFWGSIASANDSKIIQFYLNQLGFNSGPVDGQPGKKTKSALNSFYASNPELEARKVGIAAKSDLLKKAKEKKKGSKRERKRE